MTTGAEKEKNIALPFSKTAEIIVANCQNEAKRRRNAFLTTDHLILSFVQVAEVAKGSTAKLFSKLSVDKTDLLAEALGKMFNGNSATGELKHTQSYNKVLELATKEAQKSGEAEIRPVHLLIGLFLHETCRISYPSLTPQNILSATQIIKLRALVKDKDYKNGCKEQDKNLGNAKNNQPIPLASPTSQ
jgi:ATP-dependent Clp protease ATP-binding subunit ClpA